MIRYHPRQLHLFDPDDYLVMQHPAEATFCRGGEGQQASTSAETDLTGRMGFQFERTPDVFGLRRGVGPLFVGLDTSLLIAIREGLEKEDGDLGFYPGPIWSDRACLEDALRDLIQLWWWRDVRFWASDFHLKDAKKNFDADRQRARESAIDQLGRDLFERGGIPSSQPVIPYEIPPNPGRHLRDVQLAATAMCAGCQVFLTGDKGMRRWNRFFYRRGLAVLTCGDLLESLDQSGELDDTPDMTTAPAPDLAAMSRLYAGFG